MALLVDGSWCAMDDLRIYDGSATTVAAEEGVDLTAKMALSEAWITDRVDAFLRWESTLTGQNAVVDERLKRWHMSNVLAMLYRDAAFSQTNDRFEKKWKAYEQDANKRKTEYFLAGVSFVGSPVRRPSAPTVNVIVGSLAANAYSVSVARVDGSGNESSLSEPAAIQAPAGNGLTVAANGLAAGEFWNVYATNGDGPMRKQNSGVLNATAFWQMPGSGLADGLEAGDGQIPDGRVQQRRVLPRG